MIQIASEVTEKPKVEEMNEPPPRRFGDNE